MYLASFHNLQLVLFDEVNCVVWGKLLVLAVMIVVVRVSILLSLHWADSVSQRTVWRCVEVVFSERIGFLVLMGKTLLRLHWVERSLVCRLDASVLLSVES